MYLPVVLTLTYMYMYMYMYMVYIWVLIHDNSSYLGLYCVDYLTLVFGLLPAWYYE